jgi:hypothetical protein
VLRREDGDGGEGGVGGSGAGVQEGGGVGGRRRGRPGVQVRPLAHRRRAHQGARPAAHPLRRCHRHRGRRVLGPPGHQFGASVSASAKISVSASGLAGPVI